MPHRSLPTGSAAPHPHPARRGAHPADPSHRAAHPAPPGRRAAHPADPSHRAAHPAAPGRRAAHPAATPRRRSGRARALAAVLALVALVGACGSPTAAPPDTTGTSGPPPTTTSAPTLTGWRCHPAQPDDPCLTADLRTTRLDADLNTTVEDAPAAPDPGADCFYAPPASATEAEAREWVRIEAARFRTVCAVFAPEHAAGDAEALAAAFDRYLGGEGQATPPPVNRPLVLLGHGDGAALLARLLNDRVLTEPAVRPRLLSALLIGGPAVQVPAGQPAGGTFADLPLCGNRDQVGCVVSFHAYEAGTTPALDNAWFAGLGPGQEAACTNPTGLDGTKGQLRASTFPVDSPLVPPPVINSVPAVETPFITLSEYYVAECLSFGNGVRYLWVDRTIDPTDGRAPGVLTDPGHAAANLGLPQHDVTLTLGDLLFLVTRQLAAYQAAQPD